MQTTLPKGTYVPLVTPFDKQGEIDLKSLDRLIDRLLKANVEALVVLGTTGESPTVTPDETSRLIKHTIAKVGGAASVLAGVGSNDTHSSVDQAKCAMDLGVDGLLVVCPYYSRPNQQGLYEHFKTIAEQVPIPQLVYNIPARAGVNIASDTLLRLAELPNIVGVKESSGNIEQVSEVLQHVADDFLVLCGCDHLNFTSLCLGGHGVVSTVANLVPEKIKKMVEDVHSNDIRTARRLHFQLEPLVTGCSIDTNPIPVKTALAAMGEIQEIFRAPLCAMAPDKRDYWLSVIEQQGLNQKNNDHSFRTNLLSYSIRQGTTADAAAIEALLPRLADIDLPKHRIPEHLWHGDRSMIREWASGNRPEIDIAVAVIDDRIIGIAVISAKKEMFSGEPSAHLETLAIDVRMEGNGIGAALMRESDSMAMKRGAKSVSLHVLSANTRARSLYERNGFHGELMRYYKPLA